MPLLQQTLMEALVRFGDPSSSSFDASPTDEDDARTKWADAFLAYVTTMTPPTITPVSAPLVAKAFHDTLSLVPGLVGMNPLTDYAAAWNAAMLAMASAVVGGWDPAMLTLRTNTLRTTLNQLFASGSLNASERLGKIADAFHAATVGMKSSTVPPVPYG